MTSWTKSLGKLLLMKNPANSGTNKPIMYLLITHICTGINVHMYICMYRIVAAYQYMHILSTNMCHVSGTVGRLRETPKRSSGLLCLAWMMFGKRKGTRWVAKWYKNWITCWKIEKRTECNAYGCYKIFLFLVLWYCFGCGCDGSCGYCCCCCNGNLFLLHLFIVVHALSTSSASLRNTKPLNGMLTGSFTCNLVFWTAPLPPFEGFFDATTP